MKKLFNLLLVLSLIFTTSLGFCQLPTDQTWVLSDFSKGLNSHISELSTPENQAHDCSNVRYNKKFQALSKRDTLLSEIDFGTGSVNGLYRYYKSDGTLRTVGAISTLLVTDVSGTATTIKTGLTDGKRWQFITFKDKVIGTNGFDQPAKWDGKTTTTTNTDGARTASELCAELGAPFAELNTGSNLDASSWYMYKVAFYDGSTYDYSTARSNPILTGSTVRDITLTDIPMGPSGTTARYLYRTLGNASQAAALADSTYYKIATISDNTTTTYNDAMVDTTADDDAAPTWATVSAGTNVTPPKGKYIELHKERAWISGNTTYPSDLYWSDDGNPDHFLPTDVEEIRADDGDAITFIKSFLGTLRVGKTNTIQPFYTPGSSTANWEIGNPYSYIGCPAPYSVGVSPTGVIYLGRNGLYSFNGQYSSLISDAVTPQINDISQTNIAETVGFYWNNEFKLSYTSENSGQATNNRVLTYDFVRDAYTLDTESVNCFAAFSAGTDFGILYSGSSTTDGYVFAHTSTANLLPTRYKSDFDLGTYDDIRAYNTEDEPILDIAWDCTFSTWLTELQTKNASINTFADISTYLPNSTFSRPDTGGTWTSPVYDINAGSLDKLYWNEALGGYGDVTFQVRTGGVTPVDGTWSAWSSEYTNPNGTDISGLTAARYIQIKFNLSTTDVNYSPTLYKTDGFVFKITYSKVGANYETSVLSYYESGWLNFGGQESSFYGKLIKRIKVFYTGTSGTLSVNFKNDIGDIDRTFTIDLSVEPNFSSTDNYTGQGDTKIYTYYSPINSSSSPSAIGQLWKFSFTETGVVDWDIDKMEVLWDAQEIL